VEYFVVAVRKGAGKDFRHIGKDTLAQLKGKKRLSVSDQFASNCSPKQDFRSENQPNDPR
jgi:hypothetical protein